MLHTNISRLWWVGDIERKFTRDKPRPATAEGGQKPTLSIYGHVRACHAEQRRASPLRVNLEGTTSTRFAAYSLPIDLFPGLAIELSTHYFSTNLHYHPPAYRNLLIVCQTSRFTALCHRASDAYYHKMSAEDEQSQSGYEEGAAGGPGAPTPLSALEGLAGLTKRDIQLFVDGGYYTVESVAYT